METRDDIGRYIFFKFKVFTSVFTLAVLYAPNQGQIPFCLRVLKRFEDFLEGAPMLARDFNIPMDDSLDTTGKPQVPQTLRRKLCHRLQDFRPARRLAYIASNL